MTDVSKHRLLIVDDDPLALTILHKTLDKQGYEIERATNGQDAFDCAIRTFPTIILSDWMMPVMDGVTLCQRVKSEPTLNPCYFILLTAKTDLDDKVFGLDQGVDDYLVKPADAAEVYARIRAGERIVELDHMVVEN